MEKAKTTIENFQFKLRLWTAGGIVIAVFGSGLVTGVQIANMKESVKVIKSNQDIRMANEVIAKTNTMFSKFPIIEERTEENKDEIAKCKSNFEIINDKLDDIMTGLGIKYSMNNGE